MNNSKRQFLKLATAGLGTPFTAGLAGVAALAAQSAQAQSSDYRALVCLFMAGGNDAHNWVVPVDSEGYGDYSRARSSLAMPVSDLRALSAASRQAPGRQFAFASDLDPLRDLYEAGKLAVVANVGTLVRPTTRADYQAGLGLPPKLFSHNDQQSWWQSLAPEGARSGWGGRIGDAVAASNQHPVFTMVSASGNAIFLAGAAGQQYQITTSGAVGMTPMLSGSTLGSNTVAKVLQRSQFDAGSHALQAAYARTVKRSSEAYAVLAQAVSQVQVRPIGSQPVRLSNQGLLALDQLPLARQLRAVAEMIGCHQNLGMRRQVFMVSMGGFDTHGSLMRDQPALMAGVAQSINYFLSVLRDMGLENQVTLFTGSDFGRTLTSNGSGSDHGWGGHHFVAGGAVKGRDIYGRFPITALGSTDDVGSGRLLPSTSVTAYAATLARWMGLSASDIAMALPNIGNFSGTDLGFV